MQHVIAGCNTMLLGETIRLLTHGSQPWGQGPEALRNDKSYRLSSLAVLAPRIQCYRRVVCSAIVDLKPFYPSQEGAF